MDNLLRDIRSIIFGARLAVQVLRWRVGSEDNIDQVEILFPSGFIGIDASAKAWISKFQADTYGMIVDNSAVLIAKYSLRNGDVFVGRNNNYMLFRSGRLSIVTDVLNLTCNEIDITCPKIVFNGVEITVVAGKLQIGGKEVAVVGGTTSSNIINNSGQ